MKNLLFLALLSTLFFTQSVLAQSYHTSDRHENLEMVVTAHQTVSAQHSINLDKLQMETEELISALLPISVISLGELITEKFASIKSRKSKVKAKRKHSTYSI